jgi:hypothetical protein
VGVLPKAELYTGTEYIHIYVPICRYVPSLGIGEEVSRANIYAVFFREATTPQRSSMCERASFFYFLFK